VLKDSATLTAPITSLKGVGPGIAARLEKLDIRTVGDLLFHLPLRYQDRTRIVPIGSLRQGDEAVIEGEVLLTAASPTAAVRSRCVFFISARHRSRHSRAACGCVVSARRASQGATWK
jgi:RecG-like helicase